MTIANASPAFGEFLSAGAALAALAGAFLDAQSRFATACIERAQGNPLFLEELLAALAGAGAGALPDSLQALLAARIDALPEDADPATAAVPLLWRRFRQEALAGRIPNRAGTVTTCAVYTDYEGEHRGGYRCVVGAAVPGTDEVPAGMVAVAVPADRSTATLVLRDE